MGNFACQTPFLIGVRTAFSGARWPTILGYPTKPLKMGRTLLIAGAIRLCGEFDLENNCCTWYRVL